MRCWISKWWRRPATSSLCFILAALEPAPFSPFAIFIVLVLVLASARAAFEMGLPLDELNRLLDLGIKPLPWADIPYIPAALQPV